MMLANFRNIGKNLENDKLNNIVRESTGIRDKNIESLIKAAEDRSEQILEKHI
jgi:hypothetical protein